MLPRDLFNYLLQSKGQRKEQNTDKLVAHRAAWAAALPCAVAAGGPVGSRGTDAAACVPAAVAPTASAICSQLIFQAHYFESAFCRTTLTVAGRAARAAAVAARALANVRTSFCTATSATSTGKTVSLLLLLQHRLLPEQWQCRPPC